jgi:hypothetical protein
MTKRKMRSKERFQEYLRFSDAFECTFRQWLDIRKTDWYQRLSRGEYIKPWWEE